MTSDLRASATVERNDHALTPDEIDAFDRDGYLILRGRIPAPLIADLQQASQEWMDTGRLRPTGPDADDFKFADRGGREVMFRVDYVHGKSGAASLQLLGCPEMLGIAESLAGPNFVPTYESLVFKQSGDGAPIEWHQDAVHPRRHRIFNVDVYLDASRAGHGALRVVPGSQRRPADICGLRDAHGWDVPDAIEVEMEPGDVLLHDTMLVHGSPATEGSALRRTLYYEFRAAEQILSEGPWDASWVDARLRLVPLALAAYGARPDAGAPYDWRIDDALRPVPTGDDDAELRVVHGAHTPGTFCSAGDVVGRP